MTKVFKKSLAILSLVFALSLSGCGKKELPVVSISVWTDPSTEDLIKEELDAFAELHKDEAEFVFTISHEGEDTAKSSILSNPENSADVFAFADDQLDELYKAGCLLEITKDTDAIYESVGGSNTGAADAITRDGKIYAYPYTAGNGYFLYYNKAYYTDEDVKSLETILDIAAKNDKTFTMDLSSGWYLYSFYGGAGFTLLSENGKNTCNWNATVGNISGVQVTEAVLYMTSHKGYENLNDDGFTSGVESGQIIAGINGPWNAEKVSAAWGDDYGVTMLPTYTINNDNIQMYSFMGYKLIGINSCTEEPEWCMELAAFLTNEENQIKRFEYTGECPSNINASNNDEVLASPVIAALGKQAPYSSRQCVADPYWDASQMFGYTLAAGNKDNRDLQELLDNLVMQVTSN